MSGASNKEKSRKSITIMPLFARAAMRIDITMSFSNMFHYMMQMQNEYDIVL